MKRVFGLTLSLFTAVGLLIGTTGCPDKKASDTSKKAGDTAKKDGDTAKKDGDTAKKKDS